VLKQVKTSIIKHESGEKLYTKAYKDSEDHLTIGHGYRLDGDNRAQAVKDLKELGLDYEKVIKGTQELNSKQIDILADKSITRATAKVNKYISGFQELPNTVQAIVVELAFQVGNTGFSKFEDFIQAINDRNYSNAIKELYDSKLYQQAPNRVKDYVQTLRNI
jgi:hypothetical protein